MSSKRAIRIDEEKGGRSKAQEAWVRKVETKRSRGKEEKGRRALNEKDRRREEVSWKWEKESRTREKDFGAKVEVKGGIRTHREEMKVWRGKTTKPIVK